MKTSDSARSREYSAAWLVGALVGALCSGCLVIPKTTTTRRVIGTSVTKTERGAVGALELEVRRSVSGLVVRAKRPRKCVQHLATVVEVSRRTEAALEGVDLPSADGKAAAAVIAFTAPVTVLSALVTGAVLTSNSDSTTRQVYASGSRRVDCSLPESNLRVSLSLPSGEVLVGVTNSRGLVGFTISRDDSEGGIIVARSDATPPKSFRYLEPAEPRSLGEVGASRRVSSKGTPTPAIPAARLRQLRKACAIPIARWRAGEEAALPAACERLARR